MGVRRRGIWGSLGLRSRVLEAGEAGVRGLAEADVGFVILLLWVSMGRCATGWLARSNGRFWEWARMGMGDAFVRIAWDSVRVLACADWERRKGEMKMDG